MVATHLVTCDVIDPATGERRLSAGDRVKVVDLGDHYYVWTIPYDAMLKPVVLEPWMANRSLSPIEAELAVPSL